MSRDILSELSYLSESARRQKYEHIKGRIIDKLSEASCYSVGYIVFDYGSGNGDFLNVKREIIEIPYHRDEISGRAIVEESDIADIVDVFHRIMICENKDIVSIRFK